MHQRSVPLCIVLTIITCGIYGLYWMVCLTDDSTEVTGMGNTSGGMALVFSLITCGIYSIYWAYKMGEKLDMARAPAGCSHRQPGHCLSGSLPLWPEHRHLRPHPERAEQVHLQRQ